MKHIIDKFEHLGNQASYHYADDTCKEWDRAAILKSQALEIFDNNPELETELRKVGQGFLWSLNQARPKQLTKEIT